MRPLFDAVLEHCPAPALARKEDDPFRMITIQIESGASAFMSLFYSPSSVLALGHFADPRYPDPYVGTLYLGRVHSGVLRPGNALIGIDPQGNRVGEGRVKKIYVRVVRAFRSSEKGYSTRSA
jgi:predicted membrane GTPase involved in stress response